MLEALQQQQKDLIILQQQQQQQQLALQLQQLQQRPLHMLSVGPASHVGLSPRVHDLTVRNWFAINGLPLDAAKEDSDAQVVQQQPSFQHQLPLRPSSTNLLQQQRFMQHQRESSSNVKQQALMQQRFLQQQRELILQQQQQQLAHLMQHPISFDAHLTPTPADRAIDLRSSSSSTGASNVPSSSSARVTNTEDSDALSALLAQA